MYIKTNGFAIMLFLAIFLIASCGDNGEDASVDEVESSEPEVHVMEDPPREGTWTENLNDGFELKAFLELGDMGSMEIFLLNEDEDLLARIVLSESPYADSPSSRSPGRDQGFFIELPEGEYVFTVEYRGHNRLDVRLDGEHIGIFTTGDTAPYYRGIENMFIEWADETDMARLELQRWE